MVVNNVRWIQQIEAFNGDEQGMIKGGKARRLSAFCGENVFVFQLSFLNFCVVLYYCDYDFPFMKVGFANLIMHH